MQAALMLTTGPRLRNLSVVRSAIAAATYQLSDADSLEATATGLSDDSLRGWSGIRSLQSSPAFFPPSLNHETTHLISFNNTYCMPGYGQAALITICK